MVRLQCRWEFEGVLGLPGGLFGEQCMFIVCAGEGGRLS